MSGTSFLFSVAMLLGLPTQRDRQVMPAPLKEVEPPKPRLIQSIVEKTPEVALREFLDVLIDCGVCGGRMKVRHVVANYNSLRTEHGWPELSTKVISREFVERFGCQRVKVDLRHKDAGRPTFLVFPMEGDMAA